jgi:hypothetical protein
MTIIEKDGKELWVTIDNYADLFALDYLHSLVRGVEFGEDGPTNDSPLVTTAVAWFNGRGYNCDRVTATMILSEIASN